MRRFLVILSLLAAFIPAKAEVSETEQVRLQVGKKMYELYTVFRGDNSVGIAESAFYLPRTFESTPYFTMVGNRTKTTPKEIEKVKKDGLNWLKSSKVLQTLVHDLWPNPGVLFKIPSGDGEYTELLFKESDYAFGPLDPAIGMKGYVNWWSGINFMSKYGTQIASYKLAKWGMTHEYFWDAGARTLRYKPIIYENVDFDQISEDDIKRAYFGMVCSAWKLLYEEKLYSYPQGLPILLTAYQGGGISTELQLKQSGKLQGKKQMKSTVSNADLLKMLGDAEYFKACFPEWKEWNPDFEQILAMAPSPADLDMQDKIDAYARNVLLAVPEGTRNNDIRDLLSFVKTGATVFPMPGTINAYVSLDKEGSGVTLTLTSWWYNFIDDNLPTPEQLEANLAIVPGAPAGCMAIAAACALKRHGDLKIVVRPSRFGGDQNPTITVPFKDLFEICSAL